MFRFITTTIIKKKLYSLSKKLHKKIKINIKIIESRLNFNIMHNTIANNNNNYSNFSMFIVGKMHTQQ